MADDNQAAGRALEKGDYEPVFVATLGGKEVFRQEFPDYVGKSFGQLADIAIQKLQQPPYSISPLHGGLTFHFTIQKE